MDSTVLYGQSMAASAMPILLVVLLSVSGFTLVALGGGWACRELQSRKMTAIGSVCLLGVIPAAKATATVATGLLIGTSTGVGVVIVLALFALLILAAAV